MWLADRCLLVVACPLHVPWLAATCYCWLAGQALYNHTLRMCNMGVGAAQTRKYTTQSVPLQQPVCAACELVKGGDNHACSAVAGAAACRQHGVGVSWLMDIGGISMQWASCLGSSPAVTPQQQLVCLATLLGWVHGSRVWKQELLCRPCIHPPCTPCMLETGAGQ